jgi:hypothetical protein
LRQVRDRFRNAAIRQNHLAQDVLRHRFHVAGTYGPGKVIFSVTHFFLRAQN